MTTRPLTRAELDELRAVHGAAKEVSPGDWRVYGDKVGEDTVHCIGSDDECLVAHDLVPEDAVAIVSAHNNYDRLLATAYRAEKLERALTKNINHAVDCNWERKREGTCTCGALSRALGEEAGR